LWPGFSTKHARIEGAFKGEFSLAKLIVACGEL
jgi:hypothetical protein